MNKRYVLPMAPSINASYFGAIGGGRILLTDAAKAFNEESALILNQIDETPFAGLCRATMVMHMRYEHKGDHHNNHKLVLDALQGHAYQNDIQVVDLRMLRGFDHDNPHIEITIEEIL